MNKDVLHTLFRGARAVNVTWFYRLTSARRHQEPNAACGILMKMALQEEMAMFAVHPERLQIRWAVLALVNDAVGNARTLHCSQAADQLAARYPNCGMTVREIEDEIIRHIGRARGNAALGA